MSVSDPLIKDIKGKYLNLRLCLILKLKFLDYFSDKNEISIFITSKSK